jgi:hypothetical protein
MHLDVAVVAMAENDDYRGNVGSYHGAGYRDCWSSLSARPTP